MKNFGKTTDIKDIITVEYEADNAVLYSTSQSLTNNQKAQARTNIGAGTSSFDGNYNSLSNKPNIPTKTSQLNNDSNFATTSQVEVKYTKPASGIPKTDLATAVQNSLTAADNAVKYTSQSLTDAQKVQARKNIGAGTSSFSGNYKDLADKPDIPDAVSIVQSTGTSTSSVMSQKATTDAVNGKLSKTDNTNIEVLGTKKATTTLGGNQLYAPNGAIFGGTAAAAGLLTKGISGISVPTTGGACSKDNLYVNYDGNNDFNASRQIVLNAGTTGSHLGSNMYQYTVPRGDVVKNWVEAKGYATSVKVNGNTIASSGGIVDIGNVVTDASAFATSAQGSNADSALTKANANATEISNIKNGTTKVKSAEHADTADSATSAGTADKVANGLTLGGGVVYDGSKALSISVGDKLSINGGPGGVSIGLAYSVMPSTYNKVTVDGYGTVTAGENVDYLTSHQGIKKLNTNNTTAQDANASEAIAGSGTINLHKVAKTGSYNDLADKPSIPSAVTSINGLTGGTVNGNIALTKELVFNNTDNPFIKMVTGGNTYYFQSAGGQFALGPTWDLATKWSSDGSVQFPVRPKVGTADMALKSDIPSATEVVQATGTSTTSVMSQKATTDELAKKANLNGENIFTGNQTIQNSQLSVVRDSAQGSGYILDTYDNSSDANAGTILGVYQTGKDAGRVIIGDDSTVDLTFGGDPGMSGQVLTSQGAGKTPQWTTPTSGGGATDVVKYTAQTLTTAQKSQARSNIGAGTSSFSGSYNDLSDKPSFDKLTRIQKQAYTGGDNTVQYFKLASFPVYNSGGNYASFIITGRMGGWQSDNMSFVNMILYNRNGEGGGYINVANSAFFNLCDIVMYREEDGTSTAYLKVKSYYTFDINVNTYQATNVYTGTDDTPTGTLKWTASEQADRLAVSGGVAYVNGFTLPKQVEINGTVVNPNSAGLVNLGTGFAKTADLPIKSATLSGTTLTITL